MWARISVLVSALFVRSLSASKASLTGCGSSNTTSSLCVDTWQVVTSRVTWSMTYGGRRRTRHDHVSLVYVASAALVHTYPRRAKPAFCDEWTLGLSIINRHSCYFHLLHHSSTYIIDQTVKQNHDISNRLVGNVRETGRVYNYCFPAPICESSARCRYDRCILCKKESVSWNKHTYNRNAVSAVNDHKPINKETDSLFLLFVQIVPY